MFSASGYFDGATQGESKRCVAGGLLYISEKHWYKFKGLVNGTNSYAELSALQLLSWLVTKKEVKSIQILVYSQIIRKWITCLNMIRSVWLTPLLQETQRFQDMMENMDIKHAYRERNILEDKQQLWWKDLGTIHKI